MKILLLVLGEIKCLICEKKLIFLSLVLGLSLSFYSFYLMYGSIQYTIRNFYSGNEYNTYTIEIQNTEKEVIYKNIDKLTEKGLKTALMMKTNDEKPLLIGWLGQNENRWFIQNQGSFLDKSDCYEKRNVAVISDNLYPYPDVNYANYSYLYDEHEFSVKGLFSSTTNYAFFYGCDGMYEKYYPTTVMEADTDHEEHHFESDKRHPYYNQAVLIPYTTFEALSYTPDVVRLEFTVSSLKVRERIGKQLTELFPNETILFPKAADGRYTKEMWYALFKSIVICIASTINIIGLFLYWEKDRMYVYQIYYLVGAKFIDLFKLNVFCWMILLGISLALSRFLANLTKPLTALLNIDVAMTVSQIVSLYLCSMILSFILLLPYLIQMRRLKT